MSMRSYRGRHRLGTPGLVHCARYGEVAISLVTRRRSWLTTLLVPARHSFGGLRRRATEGIWVPATA
jgi:hypothetical protein